MPEVYIDTLTIEHFGPFYGEHEFDFRNSEGRCGVLIGGKNGAGKTHLLRALYLAIVGDSGVGDLKKVETDADATRFAFDRSINRRAWNEGNDTVRLKAVVSLQDQKIGGTKKIELCREIRHRPNSAPIWRSYAKRSDSDELIEDELKLQKLRDSFLPRHLARFFFFDAERSQSINLAQHDIVEGISRILGLWTYSELETDLRQLISTKIPRVFSAGAGHDPETKLFDIRSEIMRNDGHLKTRRKELTTLSRDLQELESELTDVEDDLKILGAVDPEQLSQAQQRHSEVSDAKRKLNSKLEEAWELGLPLALLGNYREELYSYLQSEEKRRDWENKKSAVEPKIPQVKEDVFSSVPEEFQLSEDYLAFYMHRLEEALLRLYNPPDEGISEDIFATDRNDVSAHVRQRMRNLPSVLQGLTEDCETIEKLDIEWKELDSKIRQMQQNAAANKRGQELHEKRGELNTRRSQITKRLDEIKAEIQKLETDLAELKRQETIQEAIVAKAQKGESLASLAAKYREAAREIRHNAAIQLRKRISEHVGELWVDIAERQREFEGMEFDKDWQCWLKRRDGSKQTWEESNTSAGQRQVRMLAFYEALRRLAKLVPPLVVDTPLSRLDKGVRVNVLDQLYLSGHQSVILATDSEIDPDSGLFDSIKDRIARVYTLHPHGKGDSPNYQVRVSGDYFGQIV
jgi:DNA sulfur modification protein DndD